MLLKHLEPERHLLTGVGVDGGAPREMQPDLVPERANPTQLTDDLGLQRVVELAVDQDEERGDDARIVFELGH